MKTFVVSSLGLNRISDDSVQLTKRSYNNNQRVWAPTIHEKPVKSRKKVVVPDDAIMVAYVPGYFFKHNTRVLCKHGREIARGVREDVKQKHESAIAWLLPDEEIRYTICGKVGGTRTLKKAAWRFDGEYLYHEVFESEGYSGPHGDRYRVHGHTGIRCVVPVKASTETQQKSAEISQKNAKFLDKGGVVGDIKFEPTGLAWYLNFSEAAEVSKQQRAADHEWRELRSQIETLGFSVKEQHDVKYLLHRYSSLRVNLERVLELNAQIADARKKGKPEFLSDFNWGRCVPVTLTKEKWEEEVYRLQIKRLETSLRLLTTPPTEGELAKLSEGRRRIEALHTAYEQAGKYFTSTSTEGNPDTFYVLRGKLPNGKSGEVSFADLDAIQALEALAEQEIGYKSGQVYVRPRNHASASSDDLARLAAHFQK